jgi:hypothetical protein
MKDWEDIAATSELLAAQEIKRSLDEGDLVDVEQGLTQLIETMGRSEKRALQSQLIRLMIHILKWQMQPEKRSRSWLITIANARFEIRKLRDFTPSLNGNFIDSIWSESMEQAIKEAEIETGVSAADIDLTSGTVFDEPYNL